MNWLGILRNAIEAALGGSTVLFAMAAVGLNLHFGYTGLLNFGHVAFLLVGAYGVAIAVTIFDLSMWLGVGIGFLGTIVLGLLLGLPTLRLRADYLAIVTLVAGEILRLTFRSVTLRDYTGGSGGLTRFAREFYDLNVFFTAEEYTILGFLVFRARALWPMVVGWTFTLLFVLFVWLLMRSPWGRVLRSIREDEDAARSLGKNVYLHKMQSLVLGGVIGGFAGMLYAIDAQAVQPDFVGSPQITFLVFTGLVLGGAATTWGPVVGAALFWGLLSATDNILRQAVSVGYVPTWLMDGVQVGQVRWMLVGLALMLLMIFRPQGIFGDRRELALDG